MITYDDENGTQCVDFYSELVFERYCLNCGETQAHFLHIWRPLCLACTIYGEH